MLSMSFPAIFLGTFVVAYAIMKIFRYWSNQSRQIQKTEKSDYETAPMAPGPFQWPIFGNVASLGDAPHLAFDEMTKKYGSVFRIKLGTVPVIVLNDIKTIKAALSRQKDIFSGRPQFPSYKLVSLGLGAVFNDSTTMGIDWKARKMKMLKHIHNYAASVDSRMSIAKHIWDEIEYMTVALEEQCEKSPTGFIDPEQVVRVAVGNAVCVMCFGKRYRVDNAQFVQLLSMNREFGLVLSAGSRIDVMPWIKIFPFYKKAAADFEALCSRMESWVLDKVKENTRTYTPGKLRNLIDALTESELDDYRQKLKFHRSESGSSMEDLEDVPIENQVDYRVLSAIINDIFGAGQDTFSSAFLFILHYMIRFPEVQQRMRQDVYNATGHDRLPDLSDRRKLPYLEAVFHEVMRHSSFVAITIPHRTLDNTVLNGYKIPKDTLVFINQYTANRDCSVWKDPYTFNPERFLKYVDGVCHLDPLKVSKYMIFSTGSRKCPGDELSKIWIMIAMASILHRCELLPDPDNPPTDAICYGLTMKPHNLRIKLRKISPGAVN